MYVTPFFPCTCTCTCKQMQSAQTTDQAKRWILVVDLGSRRFSSFPALPAGDQRVVHSYCVCFNVL